MTGALTLHRLPIPSKCAVAKSDGSRIVADIKDHTSEADGTGKLPGQHKSVDLLGEIRARAGGAQGIDQKACLDLDEGHKVDGRICTHGGENASGTRTNRQFAGTTASHVCVPRSTLMCHSAKYCSEKVFASEHEFASQSEIHPLHIGVRTFPFNVTIGGEAVLRPDLPILCDPLNGPRPVHTSPMIYISVSCVYYPQKIRETYFSAGRLSYGRFSSRSPSSLSSTMGLAAL